MKTTNKMAAGVGAPHAHDTAVGLGAVVGSAWRSKRPARKPSPATSGGLEHTGVGGYGAKLTQPHRLQKAATGHRMRSRGTAPQRRTAAFMPWPSATPCMKVPRMKTSEAPCGSATAFGWSDALSTAAFSTLCVLLERTDTLLAGFHQRRQMMLVEL